MHISRFKITNYKSFLDLGEITLTPRFNVVVGENNAGKTALAEALSLQFSNKPHKSELTVPRPGALHELRSSATVSFELSEGDLSQILRDRVGGFVVPARGQSGVPNDSSDFLEHFRSTTLWEAEYSGGSKLVRVGLVGYDVPQDAVNLMEFTLVDGKAVLKNRNYRQNVPLGERLGHRLLKILSERVYAFRAERFGLAMAPFGRQGTLAPDAGNLASALNVQMSSDRPGFDDYCDLVRAVLPRVKGLSVPPARSDGSKVEVLVWTEGRDRADLAVSLAESGTGISQVLAILHVVATADSPKVIIIDEPQSFLHPGAIRKLIEILKAHPQHQYIITTHSPTVVSAADPSTLLRVRLEGPESKIDVLGNSAEDMQRILVDVGARLSDVFGADRVLWIEGRTEEICFPIVVAASDLWLRGTVIRAVLQTGDLEGRDKEKMFRIYRSLTTGGDLVPPAAAFLFDKEGRSEAERSDLIREARTSGIPLHFLPRRMFENYLLHAEAIADVLSTCAGDGGKQVAPQQVTEWLNEHARDAKYGAESNADEKTLRATVHGGDLLQDLFDALSDTAECYDKVKHGQMLTRWICEHAPGEFAELVDLLGELLAARAMDS